MFKRKITGKSKQEDNDRLKRVIFSCQASPLETFQEWITARLKQIYGTALTITDYVGLIGKNCKKYSTIKPGILD